jgi:hypothetical protein
VTTRAEAKAELHKLAYDLRHGPLTDSRGENGQPMVAVPATDALRSLTVIEQYLDGEVRRPIWLTDEEREAVRDALLLTVHDEPEEDEDPAQRSERDTRLINVVGSIDNPGVPITLDWRDDGIHRWDHSDEDSVNGSVPA